MIFKPIHFNEFDLILKRIGLFEDNPQIALALSGGADSTALLFLLNKWVLRKKGCLMTFIVDHGLRKNSFLECLKVKEWANQKKIKCKILRWIGKKPKSKLMEIARNERYKLIFNACEKEKIIHLMFGHHLNDRLETLYMRSKRKGNIVGLSTIPQIRENNNLRIIRPFINIRKERLIETCRFYKQSWIEDPSNENEKFERVRIRNILNEKNLNYISSKILEINKNIIKRDKYEETISYFFLKNLSYEKFGFFKLIRKELFNQNTEIQIQIIKKILTTISGEIFPPRKKSVENLLIQIKKEKKITKTLHFTNITSNNTSIHFIRESQKTKKEMAKGLNVMAGESNVWDKRFLITTRDFNLKCKLISNKNWDEVNYEFFCKKKREISYEIIKTLPLILCKGKKLIPFVNSRKDFSDLGIDFFFYPKIPLTSNKFSIINCVSIK